MLEIVSECIQNNDKEATEEKSMFYSPSTDFLLQKKVKWPFYYQMIKRNVDESYVLQSASSSSQQRKSNIDLPGGDTRLYKPTTPEGIESQYLTKVAGGAPIPHSDNLSCCSSSQPLIQGRPPQDLRRLIRSAFSDSVISHPMPAGSGRNFGLTQSDKGIEVTSVFLRNVPSKAPPQIASVPGGTDQTHMHRDSGSHTNVTGTTIRIRGGGTTLTGPASSQTTGRLRSNFPQPQTSQTSQMSSYSTFSQSAASRPSSCLQSSEASGGGSGRTAVLYRGKK
uniref:Uncharacterized protein n=1 Tax=Polytomella parva TaxID=51329 RepID=A0A7S0YEG8_9CHLO|mmetsp:Transcript_13816/g.24295  ORF Transcript_13816/g.24295 Transcript_13816/m.24295 type:complete len:280 (+) Transcript_13816:150-989(+)|eukprot:CAMPEP_0175071882 /NCGR_PEP_ID=MMETSP0052_2-20121109/19532_1 /TAXON_ID=51329 ORGANISM="Polytomella parva, Strain SAG 63-3" /NCGR_SAMPLE_ID=MMETSP0052_2 /ASSEMBLY_ACC=CAM_ASM_000194 /LENGTH=279 /DNA_ID=CAMNT_0016339187 /DNA_START=74 /DNA_END=913 /DNA_ORIENTATION=-